MPVVETLVYLHACMHHTAASRGDHLARTFALNCHDGALGRPRGGPTESTSAWSRHAA